MSRMHEGRLLATLVWELPSWVPVLGQLSGLRYMLQGSRLRVGL